MAYMSFTIAQPSAAKYKVSTMRHTSNCCHSRLLRAKRESSRAATAAKHLTSSREANSRPNGRGRRVHLVRDSRPIPVAGGIASRNPRSLPPAQCLPRRLPKRAVLGNLDRLVFCGLYHLSPTVLDALESLPPEAVIRWHRAVFPSLLALEITTAGSTSPEHGCKIRGQEKAAITARLENLPSQSCWLATCNLQQGPVIALLFDHERWPFTSCSLARFDHRCVAR
jgi:hypothetical protein